MQARWAGTLRRRMHANPAVSSAALMPFNTALTVGRIAASRVAALAGARPSISVPCTSNAATETSPITDSTTRSVTSPCLRVLSYASRRDRRVTHARHLGIDPKWGVTAVRVSMALIFIIAGWGKVMGGLGNVVNAFGRMGIPMPGISGPFIAFLELLGGLALLVGCSRAGSG